MARSDRDATDRRMQTIAAFPGPDESGPRGKKEARGRRPAASKRTALIALLCAVAAGAAGYQAWEYREGLAQAQGQIRELERSLELRSGSASPAAKRETEPELDKAENALSACRQEVRQLDSKEKSRKELKGELDLLTSRFRKMIASGRLNVSFRRGQMVVKLPAQVLFASGAAQLSQKGEEAVAAVAKVLRDMKGRRFIVSGHTDSMPISGGEFANNWELSTARALSVTWMLIDNGVKPGNLAAAGHGHHKPIASNKSSRGRRLNRRIEIVLEPELRKLPLERLANAKRSRSSKKGR